MNLINNEQKMLDIVFAKRNKSYGAYAIRSAYGNTMVKSLFIVFMTLATTIGLILWLKDSHVEKIETGQVFENDSLLIIPMDLLKEKLEEPRPMANNEKPAAAQNNNNSQNATAINDHAADTAHQTVNTDLHASNSTSTTGTDGTSSNTSSVVSSGTSTSTSNNPVDLFSVDENPEFEGGYPALMAFIRKHLKYPNTAVEQSKQGTLYVKFVVDENGKISNVLLQNNLGYGLDDEAVRVVSMIPNFKSPGKVKGKAVKTYYQLPIKFKLG
jgi:protein TonB